MSETEAFLGERTIIPETYFLETKYSGLVGDEITVGGVLGYIAAEKGRLDEVKKKLTKEDQPISTELHEVLMEKMAGCEEVVMSDEEFDFEVLPEMTIGEWRMFVAIARGAKAYLSSKGKVSISGLTAVCRKVGDYVDSYVPNRQSSMYGWTIPEYDKDGQVRGYTEPPYRVELPDFLSKPV